VALTGLIDGTLFNTSDYLRGLVGTDAVINTDAAAYQVGQYSSMAMGLAGLAKVLPSTPDDGVLPAVGDAHRPGGRWIPLDDGHQQA
jgi:hypothetical protein